MTCKSFFKDERRGKIWKLKAIKTSSNHKHLLKQEIPKCNDRQRMLTCLILAVNRRERNIIQGNIASFGTIESNFKNNLQRKMACCHMFTYFQFGLSALNDFKWHVNQTKWSQVTRSHGIRFPNMSLGSTLLNLQSLFGRMKLLWSECLWDTHEFSKVIHWNMNPPREW